MSEEDHSKIQENSNQDGEREENHSDFQQSSNEDARTEKSNGQKTQVDEDIAEGYETPTSDNHKIPLVASCPPPPPKKRKRLNENRKMRPLTNGRLVMDKDQFELFLDRLEEKSAAAQPPPPPVPEPDTDLSISAKKRQIDDK